MQGILEPDENAPLSKERLEEHERFRHLDAADAKRRKMRQDKA